MSIIIISVSLTLGAYLAFSRRLNTSSSWKAIVTPLASIMGSGFLVSAPLLAGIVGNLAVVCMAVLLVVAYLVGSVIRFNIRHFEPIENQGHGPAQDISFLSRIALVGAYFISVTYYLELLSAFLLRTIGLHSPVVASSITTALLLIIGGIGIWRGLKELGAFEKYAVAFNLATIGALLVSLVVYNIHKIIDGTWALSSISSAVDFKDLRVLLGLLIVVQGFETSRYLGDEFSAEHRIKTMRIAQIISTVIYLLFIALATVLFHDGLGADVTAIIGMITPVAVILPILVALTAIGSQFSAAVADSEGAGGLLEDITQHKLPTRYAYLLILLITVLLTWSTNVNGIIAYASRAFALYYMLQCTVAWIIAWQRKDLQHRIPRLVIFAIAAVICLLVLTLGIPSG